MSAQKVRADMILRQIARKHNNVKVPDVFFTEVKNGSTWFTNNLLKLDAISIKKSWKNPCITGYEVKVDRQDFLRDTKWVGYKKYCNLFNFVCPVGLIEVDEVSNGVGLIWYNPEKETLQTKKKALFRDIELPWEMLYYLVISRTESVRHPFFSDTREMLEAWVKDKESRKSLGYYVKSKLLEQIDAEHETNKDLKRKLENQEEKIEQVGRIEEILKKHGLRTYMWAIERDLEEALSTGMPKDLLKSVKKIRTEVNQILGGLED